ncbi:MAG: phosphate/phosphite/phosphonate ABC transporter substrate-binding protein [Hylemonella sp.]|nr:phosphate/phosphite/phosphonate ABC transporter substrate-binding protein [Hylemonella sp.]
MRIMLRIARVLQACCTVLAFTGVSVATAQLAAGGELRFSVAPYLSPARMEELYTPMAAQFGQELGQPVSFRTSSTFDRYFEQVTAGGMDFTLLHAFFYVEAVDKYGYLPIARMKEPFQGLLVVLDQSPVRTLGDLRGKPIATPPEYLPTVHLVRRVMREQRFSPDKDFAMRSFRSVESCLQQVVIGEAQACICPPFALPGAEARFKVKFRTIVESPPIPNLTFVAHPRVPAAERERLRKVILGWSNSEEGRRLNASIGSGGFVEARDAEFDGVRSLMKGLDLPWLPTPR